MTILLPSSRNRLSDDQLVAEVKRLAHCERGVTAELIAHLAELDSRRLYLGLGFASLFVYCTGALRLSEHEAYNRIEAARTARRFPSILDLLHEGKLNLTTIRLLAPHLTNENHEDLLACASGGSRREVEELLAARFPRPPVPSSIRKVPDTRLEPATNRSSIPDAQPASVIVEARNESTPTPVVSPAAATDPAPRRRAALVPLASDLYKFTFSAPSDTRQKLQRVQDLLRHNIPDGNLAEIFDRALSALLEELERKKLAATNRPRRSRGTAPGSRHIPAEVRRAVWRRDAGRCAFVAKDGRRCNERGFLEFHHAQPFAAGGDPSELNIALRCRSHNRYEADLYFAPTRSIGLAQLATRFGRSSTTTGGPHAVDGEVAG